eukprot:TRINITY_DN1258_c0_g1_i1.p1 TRINITY_DN1258_c0_g1~~TRINITY_DN1258_c0_g1_i1.p1  ORF type:complete len:520 (+),score=188.77 TRINITY_DN1258_c0_g1_i1:60-1562(+)
MRVLTCAALLLAVTRSTCDCAADGVCSGERPTLEQLEQQKAAAVEQEDFLEAARLKGLIVAELEVRKLAAVEEEDFQEAARLKQRLEALRGKKKAEPKKPAGGKPAASDAKPKKGKLFGVDVGAQQRKQPAADSSSARMTSRTPGACDGAPNFEGHRPGCEHSYSDSYTGSKDCGMVRLDGGSFRMGSEFNGEQSKHKDLKSRYGDNTIHGINVADAEHPIREVTVRPFRIDRCEVTNAQFKEFVDARQYVTDAEVYQWSFVMEPWVSKELMAENPSRVEAAPWWLAIEGADWRHPEGPKSDLSHEAVWVGKQQQGVPNSPSGDRWAHPVSHVSWRDAYNFCKWRGKRLPTEAEWEFAVRGGLDQKIFPWGDQLYPGNEHRMNVWQGDFKGLENTAEDGRRHTAPVASYPPNGFGLYDMTGNLWEWVDDDFTRGEQQRVADRPEAHGSDRTCPRVVQKTKRGGSYMCHASTCNRYRTSARTGIESDSSTSNLGFRCASDA